MLLNNFLMRTNVSDLGSSFTMRAEVGPLVKEIYRLTLQLKITDHNCCKSKNLKSEFW